MIGNDSWSIDCKVATLGAPILVAGNAPEQILSIKRRGLDLIGADEVGDRVSFGCEADDTGGGGSVSQLRNIVANCRRRKAVRIEYHDVGTEASGHILRVADSLGDGDVVTVFGEYPSDHAGRGCGSCIDHEHTSCVSHWLVVTRRTYGTRKGTGGNVAGPMRSVAN